MRTSWLLAALLATAVPARALTRITPQEAARHRGERVTLAGPVSDVKTQADGLVLMIGRDFPVPVRVPAGRADAGALRGRDVALTGSLTRTGEPLELVLDRPEELDHPDADPTEDIHRLRARVRELEDQITRLNAATPRALEFVEYGPSQPPPVIGRYATQTVVLGERGVPTRMEWSAQRRVMYYGRERWTFDQDGQLVSVEREP